MAAVSQFLSFEVLIFVLPSAFVCVAVGVFFGWSFARLRLPRQLQAERKRTIEALHAMLQSTKQLTSDVEHHNDELRSVEESVTQITIDGDLEVIQERLLSHITAVVASNKRMEDDLVVTRYRLEEQAQELDQTRLEALTDQLSGLQNRKSFDEAIRFAVSQYNRQGVAFSLLLCDVDHFKRINDTFGHQAGDLVVQNLGKLLREQCRPDDHVSRYGGDEFALLLIGAAAEEAKKVAARLRDAVGAATFDFGSNERISVTASMGMAFCRDGDSTESVFERADKSLYRSKANGRNQIHIWDNPRCVAEPGGSDSTQADSSGRDRSHEVRNSADDVERACLS